MKKITTIIIFLVGIILGIFIKSEYDIVKSKNVVVKEDFIFKGKVKNTVDITEERKSVDDTSFKSNIDTMGVYGRTNGIVPNAKSAVDIAKAILYSSYGEEKINEEKPFNVELQNGKAWHVFGSLPKGYIGGVFEIWIQKSDGKILCLYHTK